MRFALAFTAGAVLAGCAGLPTRAPDELEARVKAVLERRGLGSDALGVMDNMLKHEAPTTPHTPPLVRELLARPLAAADAAAIFERSVPAELRRLAEAMREETKPAKSVPARELLEPYLRDLAEAQKLLRAATHAPIDSRDLLGALETELPPSVLLARVALAVEPAAIERANRHFLEATARFVRALRSARVQFPEAMERFESPIGTVIIGTPGDDRHAAGAALILDPGGNDTYERAPATGGAVSIVVDLGGDDRYVGPDIALHALSAIIDLAGDDRYLASGTGLGAAIAGASLILDLAGDDHYEATIFGEGAAAFGLGAILDLAGDDRYRIRAGGQGFGMAGGVGLLWDFSGSDHFHASGLADDFNRGGGVSMAQGVGLGGRTAISGGTGLLRDDAGDDRYEAEMFAQGAAYYLAVGLLWDRGGDDRYRAVRYAQGCGVHLAAGILRDDSGHDGYTLGVGVGQGMGLDLSVGLLHDGAGDDEYEGPVLVQGAATANGVGVLADLGGSNRWRTGPDRRGWGRAEWVRELPSVGVLLYEPGGARFERDGKPVPATPEHAALGGPEGGAPIEHEAEPVPPCPPAQAAAAGDELPLAEALDALLPRMIEGRGDPQLFASIRRRLAGGLRESMAALPRGNFSVSYALGEALRCTLAGASEDEARPLWDEIERQLTVEPRSPFTGALLAALRGRSAPPAQMQRILMALDVNPRCGIRSFSLSLRNAQMPEAAVDARKALRSACWREQAQAVAMLKRLGIQPDPAAPLPSFLRRQ